MDNFCVNESVICTHDFIMRGEQYIKHVPIKGNCYFIRKIFFSNYKGTGEFLLLKEIINPEYDVEGHRHNEVGFSSKFFEVAEAKKIPRQSFFDIFNNILRNVNDSHQQSQSFLSER